MMWEINPDEGNEGKEIIWTILEFNDYLCVFFWIKSTNVNSNMILHLERRSESGTKFSYIFRVFIIGIHKLPNILVRERKKKRYGKRARGKWKKNPSSCPYNMEISRLNS